MPSQNIQCRQRSHIILQSHLYGLERNHFNFHDNEIRAIGKLFTLQKVYDDNSNKIFFVVKPEIGDHDNWTTVRNGFVDKTPFRMTDEDLVYSFKPCGFKIENYPKEVKVSIIDIKQIGIVTVYLISFQNLQCCVPQSLIYFGDGKF